MARRDWLLVVDMFRMRRKIVGIERPVFGGYDLPLVLVASRRSGGRIADESTYDHHDKVSTDPTQRHG